MASGCARLSGDVEPTVVHASAEGSERLAGPLDEIRVQILGADWAQIADPEDAQLQFEQSRREQQTFLAQCMWERGFTYYSETDFTRAVIMPLQPGEAALDTREWAEQFGFGLSTSPAVNPLVRHRARIEHVGDDLNLLQRDQMSDAERAAWDEAFWGLDAWSRWEGTPLSDVPRDELGCWMQLVAARSEPVSPFGAVHEEIARFDEMVNADPRAQALNGEWVVCMTAGGHRGPASPGQLIGGLTDEWNSRDQLAADVFVAWDWEGEPGGPPAPFDPVDFREREMALAVADWDCRAALGYDVRLRAIDIDLQQQFVELHRNELDAWIEYAAAARG